MIGTMLAIGLGCLACSAHYGSDKRWHLYKETPQQYRARKVRNARRNRGW